MKGNLLIFGLIFMFRVLVATLTVFFFHRLVGEVMLTNMAVGAFVSLITVVLSVVITDVMSHIL